MKATHGAAAQASLDKDMKSQQTSKSLFCKAFLNKQLNDFPDVLKFVAFTPCFFTANICTPSRVAVFNADKRP